jgi:sec-independent protein translocase protein TatA
MNVGPMEIIVVLALALLVFGPKRLPQMGRTLGRAAREFRKASDEIKGVFDIGLNDDGGDGGIDGGASPARADAAAGAAVMAATESLPRPQNVGSAGAADEHARAAAGAEAVPGLAGFLGVAADEPAAADETAAGDEDPAAPAFASFFGAGAGAAADAAPEETETPAAAGSA